jgi:preprotein translocase subunit SecA
VVLGTERHESRRIDNQLRGRTGRQGDPGISQFFVSIEDDLMRIFATDRVKSIMGALQWPEDMPIENKIVSRSIETAQKKVEGRNFDIREHLVKYDDVMNRHREVVYKKRNEILLAKPEEIRQIMLDLIEGEVEHVVAFHTSIDNEEEWNIAEVYETINSIFPVEQSLRKDLATLRKEAGDRLQDAQARTHIVEYLMGLAKQRYDAMTKQVGDHDLVYQIERGFYLRAIDTLWIEHLDQMAYLRESISLRGYGQRDPLVEYKKEAYGMFTELIGNIQKQVVYSIFKMADVYSLAPSEMKQTKQELHGAAKTMNGAETTPVVKTERAPDGSKVGRNDPCYCGSGKKYKKCHGA